MSWETMPNLRDPRRVAVVPGMQECFLPPDADQGRVPRALCRPASTVSAWTLFDFIKTGGDPGKEL